MAGPPEMSIHIRLNADANVVPEQRWLYLDRDELEKHLQSKGLGIWGSRPMLAQRLKSERFRYDQVLTADHLKIMLKREGLQLGGERRLLEDRLASTPPKSVAEMEEEAAKAAAKAAGAGARKRNGAASAPTRPTQWKKELNRLATELEERGDKMTKEMCAARLHGWQRLKEGHTVYHIISPVNGGVDHPDNYCVLPDYVPADYHLGDAKAKMHHILMFELLAEADIKRALATSLGEELVTVQFKVLQELVKAFKKGAAGCGYTRTTRATRQGTAQPNDSATQGTPSAAPQDGSEAGPSSAAQAEHSTDARNSKRARTEEPSEA